MGTEWNDQKTAARKCKYGKARVKRPLKNRKNKDFNYKSWADPEEGTGGSDSPPP